MSRLAHRIMLVLMMVISTATYADTTPPRDVVMSAANGMADKLLANKERVQTQDYYLEQLIDEEILPVVDHVYMARLVLGKFWRRASEAQQRQFVEAFKHKVIRTYAGAFRAYDDQKMRFSEARMSPSGNRALVKSEIMRVASPAIKVDYKLFSRDDRWQIYDVVIEGVSLVKSFSDQMTRSIEQHGLAQAISKLADEYKDEAPTAYLGSPTWGPYVSDMEPEQGLASAIVKQALAASGWNMELSIRPQQAVDEAVTAKKLNGWLALWPDDAPDTLQSAPFLENHLVIVTHQQANLTMAGLQAPGASNLKLGLFENADYDADVLGFAQRFERHYRPYCSQLFRDLARQELDLVIVDRWIAERELQDNDTIGKHLQILTPQLVSENLHVTMPTSSPDAQRIIDAFNQGLRQLQASGAYQRLLQDYNYPDAKPRPSPAD